MKSLTVFLRIALAQFTTLLNALIRALQIQRRAQLIAVLVVSVVIGFFVARTVQSTRATRHQWTSQVSILVTSNNLAAGESLTNANTHRVGFRLQTSSILFLLGCYLCKKKSVVHAQRGSHHRERFCVVRG